MGIKGLTGFIQRNQEYCMVDYELCNTPVVIDGNAITCYLYNNVFSNRNDSFGGDYDKFGQVVHNFFKLLSSCNITPYLIFDGGYGSAKIPEIMRRMHDRVKCIQSLEKLNVLKSAPLFPLHMWGTFESIAKKLNVKLIRCSFDCDLECANIGRALNCPVLSNDSDFYLCDILYVPLSTFQLDVHKKGSTNYISCKIYSVDRFLDHFQLDKTKLPLLAVIIGNDNSDRDDAWYFSNLIKQDNSRHSPGKHRIQSTISWLQKYNTDSAIHIINRQSDPRKARRLYNTICRAYKTYTCCDSQYLKYLGIEVENVAKIGDPIMEKYSRDAVDDGMDKNPNLISEYFLENFKNCLYPSALMDIVSKNRFFCYPQVDDLELVGAYKSSLDIIGTIHKILNRDQSPLTYLGRTQGIKFEEFQMPLIEKDVPYIDEIKHLDVESRKKIIAVALDFDDTTFAKLLNEFPESWHVYILALKYMIVKTQAPKELVAALILSKLILGHIDGEIGFYRSRTALHEKYPQVEKSPESTVTNNIKESLLNIPLDNCLHCVDTFIPFFNVQENFRLDRCLIRRMSEFQATLLHLIYLHKLLGSPLEAPLISECLNCTFVYQLTQYLARPTDFYGALKKLMKNSSVIYDTVVMIIKKVN